MTDYTKNQNYTAKDALNTSDPEKLILGSDIDSEFDEIATAIATKFDSADIATLAQAQAETSNAVLITPLRLANWADNAAGMVGDLQALADPDADRILFWDDGAGAAALLTVGTGLTLSGTTLTSDTSTIDHDTLLNFVANEHIDHTSVTITAGEGLVYGSGGTDISASATLDLDINGLTNETTLDITNDLAVFYDNSASAHRKIPLTNFIGTALGDGKWYRNSTQALSSATEATLVFNTADYDSLERGTFSTSTGQYTVGAAAIRVQVYAQYSVAAVNNGQSLIIIIEVDSVEVARTRDSSQQDSGTEDMTIQAFTTLSVAAGAVIQIRAVSSAAENTAAGIQETFVSIVELS